MIPPTPEPSSSSLVYLVTAAEQRSIFSVENFEDRLRHYLHDTFNVEITIERTTDHPNELAQRLPKSIVIKMTGSPNDLSNASQDLLSLFTSLRKKVFQYKTSKKIRAVFGK